jgi:drug/metabolite transporter (DMT)-like permease
LADDRGLGGVLVRRLRTDLPVESMQGWVMVVGAPLLHAGSLAFREPQVGSIDWTVDAVVALVYLTLVVGGVGFLLYLRLLDRIGPSRSIPSVTRSRSRSPPSGGSCSASESNPTWSRGSSS